LSIGLLIVQVVNAQPDRWQQAVDYKMDVDFNIKTHQLTGKQKIKILQQ
jgi:hypothetical protein